MMDSKKAIAVLAFSLGAGAVALPQIKPVLAPAILAAPSLPIATPPVPIAFGTTTQASGPGATVSAGGGVGINSPVGGLLGSVSKPSGLPTVNSLPLSLPAVDALPIPALPVPALPVPNLPIPNLPIPNLPIPNLPVPNLPVPNLPVPNLPIPGVPAIPNNILSELSSGDQSAAIKKICELGTTVLSVILGVLSNGLGISLPKLPIDLPLPLTKRQLGGVGSILPIPTPITGSSGGLLGSLPIAGGVTAGLPIVGGGANPVASLPVIGSVLGGASGSGSSSPLAPVTNAVGSLPVVGSVVGGATNSLPLPGLSGAGNPLGAVTGAVGGAVGTVTNAAAGVPAVGGIVNTALNTVGQTTSNLPLVGGLIPALDPAPLNGIPGSDPVGALSVSIIATLLSLLKKDPLSLFGGLGGGLPALPVPALVKRDAPHLSERELEERMQMKRQLNLPSLSSGISGVGVGSLPLSGIPGVNPDLAALIGGIAKNIAIPGGNGLGSVTGNILGVLNGVVPNFLFKLPVVHDSVPTFGVLQLLSSINPAKFSALGSLTNLGALQQATSALPAADLAFIKGLPSSPDPSNLITTITTLTDNILSLPGNVGNLKAATAALSLKNLGLAVPGL